MARRKSGTQILALFGALFFAAVYLGSLFQQDESQEDDAAAPIDRADGPGAYALDVRRSDWPPLNEKAGAAVTIAPDTAAINYYLVLDGSGSMQRKQCSGDDNKITVALSALGNFVAQVPPGANLGLAVFDDSGLGERVPLAAGNRDAVLGELSRVNARGGTPLRSAIQLAYDRLTAQAQRQLGYGEYHLVVVTDGHADPEHEDPQAVVETLLASSPVILHTIGFCIGSEHVLNQPGRSFYLAADSPAQLQEGLSEVLAEATAFDATQFAQ